MSSEATATLAVLHLSAVCVAVGIMWSVELFVYPLFAFVGQAMFVEYHAQHCRRITPLVGVVLGAELVTGTVLAFEGPSVNRVSSLLLTLAGITITGIFAVPAHNRLGAGFDPAVHRRLRVVHRLRTAVWTAHMGLLLSPWTYLG